MRAENLGRARGQARTTCDRMSADEFERRCVSDHRGLKLHGDNRFRDTRCRGLDAASARCRASSNPEIP